MYGPASLMFPRVVQNSGIHLKDYELPKGCVLQANLVAVHFDPKLYENPYEFKPERWKDWAPGKYSFVPFSYGVRNCIGQHLFRMEAKILIIQLFKKLKLTALSPHSFRSNLAYGIHKS